MNILLVNDDGYSALGIVTLAQALVRAHHKVTVVAPNKCYSGAGHAMIFHKPMRVQVVDGYDWDCYSLEGNPADCVKLGLQSVMLNDMPDLLISGINNEPNVGDDIQCSGTANATIEGANASIPSLALSGKAVTQEDFDYLSKLFIDNMYYFEALANKTIPLNINLFNDGSGILKSKITQMGIRKYVEYYIKEQKQDGSVFYTLTGYPIAYETPDDSDVSWFNKGYTTITPLMRNLTDYDALARMKKDEVGQFND